MRCRRVTAAIVAAFAVAAAAPAAAAPPRGLPSRAATVAALHRAEAVRSGHGVAAGRDLTLLLARVSAGLPRLTGSDRDAAEALLARPDDSQQDPAGTHKWSGPEDGKSPWCVPHFCIHWAKSGVDAPAAMPDDNHNQVPDSVEQMAAIFETEVHPCENGTAANACAFVPGAGGSTPGLGWREPATDGGRGGNDLLDVYIEDLFPSAVFGYVAVDPGQPEDPAVPHHAYMVMDKDYSRFANGSASEGLADERVTAAHEYNHVLQNAYDYLQDGWMLESTAVWTEDKVYPQVDDYLKYVDDWVASPGQPLTLFSNVNLKQYGSAVWNHWLDHRYGAALVRAAWEDSPAAANFAPAAYDAAILGAGGAGFSDEFDRFAAAVSEWRAGTDFPDRYPDVARGGSLPAGNVTAPFALAHTGFALFDVPVPAGVPVIRLTATLPGGTAGGLALVGRTGADTTAGTVTSNVAPMPAGDVGAVTLSDPGSFGRITAVVANSDFATTGFDPLADDYVFAHDAPSVVASVDGPGPPVVTTGGALTAGDHDAGVTGTVDPHLLDTSWSVEYGKTTRYGRRTTQQSLPASVLTPAHVLDALPDLDARTLYHYRLIASNSAGQVAGNDMTLTTARDVTRPALVVRLRRRQHARTVRFQLKVSERITGTARLELSRGAARGLGVARLLARGRLRLGPRTRLTTKSLRLPRRVVKRLRSQRAARATLSVQVADASRSSRTVRRRVTLTR
jgi:hypothetical protein